MADFKVIACVQAMDKYHDFFEIANKKYPLLLVTDLLMLQNLLVNDPYDTVVIFLDHVYASRINKELLSIFQKNEYFCIVLHQKQLNDMHENTFVYDILDCSSRASIEGFLIKLDKNLARQLQLDSMKNELSRFYDIGKKLTAEKDIQVLLELIIDTCIELTASDAGTIYIVIDADSGEWSTFDKYNDNKKLKFAFTKNKSVKVNLESIISPILNNSISGYSVITGKPICIDDAYHISADFEYKFNAKFDENTGYKTKSLLTVPMKDHQNKVMGVIQLLNKKGMDNSVISYSAKDTSVIDALAGVAAVVLENNFLYKKTENLLEDYKLAIYEEINKRKQADEEINKLLSAVEHSPNTVIITNANGIIQYVNPKFTELTGYQYKEVIGKTPGILKSGLLSEEFYKEFWNTIRQGVDWYGEFFNRKKSGELYWESTRISSLKDENGLIKYFISVREDITDKKLTAQKLTEKNIELQETIRKLHETQAQLIQSEKMAGIGQLAAGVAHEINNPIGFIMSNMETLKKYVSRFKELLFTYKRFKTAHQPCSDGEKKELLDEIENYEKKNHIEFLMDDLKDLFDDTEIGLKRVRDIVSSLRVFSHIDQLESFSAYDLNEGIRSTLIISNNELKSAADVCVSLGDIPVLPALGGKINQALLNFIINAAYAVKAKFGEEKGVITIKTYQDGNFVCCEISDNGIGIDEKVRNRIFEPFFTTKPVGKGTGLGLSLTYDTIVKSHHGEILVESELNKGTKFIIKLPVNIDNKETIPNENHA